MTKNAPYLIFGAQGQVGSALAAILGKEAIALGREKADFTQIETLQKALQDYKPKAIFNASAYTNVEKAESEEALAMQINYHAVKYIADYCAEHQIPLIHFSTDYVFDGKGDTAWRESNRCVPLNIYGKSKRLGEEAIIASQCPYLILRTSWVYKHSHGNFLTTMLRLAKERQELSVVADQIGAPTYADDLAAMSIKAYKEASTLTTFPSGIYHLCPAGETSWHGFASYIFDFYKKHIGPLAIEKLNAISSQEYPTKATRPLNSRLNCQRIESTLQLTRSTWQEGLERCLEKLKEEAEK
jgi:dTDP-4-dehydrorhamnose reductase